MRYKKNTWITIITVVIGLVFFMVSLVSLIKRFIIRPKATLSELLWLIAIGLIVYLWCFFHDKAISKSKIDWTQYSDLRKIKNAIIILGIICLILSPIHFLSIPFLEGFLEGYIGEAIEAPFRIPSIMRLSLIIFPYIAYCDYIFVSGNPNALFHVRSFFMLLLLPFIIWGGFLCLLLYQDRLFMDFSNKLILCSFIILPFLLACVVKLILITCGANANEAFPKKERKISILDLFLCFFLYYGGVGLYSGNISFVENFVFKQEQKPIIENPKNPIVIFYPQNATIVDSEGHHSFGSYDAPNMNVTDKCKSVKVSWGGNEVVLNETENSEDTYFASAETSKGKLTIIAYRSSRSGKIYLVTVQMPNPTPNVDYITINFKP